MVVLTADPINPSAEVVERAASVLSVGGTVAAPTETVYGLFAHAHSAVGCLKVFKAKRRPLDNPLIVHVDSLEMAHDVGHVPPELENVLRRIWPGPITVVMKSRGVLPNCITAGLDTVAVRAPAHPIPLAIIRKLKAPMAGPSANRAGRPSPTTAQHVIEDLAGEVDLIIDGGPTFFGVESTIIDVTKHPPVLLRPGPFTVEELEKIFGSVSVPPAARGLAEVEVALAPGMKYRHYAPETPLVVSHVDLGKAAAALEARGVKTAVLCIGDCPPVGHPLPLGEDLYQVAKNLYGVLRELDRLGVDVGLAPAVEERGIGLAIMNRLRKASVGREVRSLEELYVVLGVF